jgi:hypothetical protein
VCAILQVYSIEKATLKVANKKFSHINNDYEITISPASVVEAVADTFPGLVCHFAPLSDIREKKADDLLNTIGTHRPFPIMRRLVRVPRSADATEQQSIRVDQA